jgi:hypothetical protein
MNELAREPEAKPAFFFAPGEVTRSRAHDAVVFVRTHKWDAKVELLVTQLASAATNYDVCILYDIRRGEPPPIDFSRLGIAPDRLIRISERMCAEVGFYKGPGLVFYHCGDVALCYAMRVVAPYKFYAMLDWDVHFRPGREGMMADLFAKLLADPGPPDFVGLNTQRCRGGSWYAGAIKVFPDEATHYAYFPFILLSRPLLAMVYTQRQLHETSHPKHMDLVNGEVFVPSLAVSAGFKLHDLRDYMPDSYDRKTIAMNSGENLVGWPLEAVGLLSTDVAMIHPVYLAEDFVASAKRRFLRKDQPRIEQLRDHLKRPEWEFIPRALTEDLRAAAADVPAQAAALPGAD